MHHQPLAFLQTPFQIRAMEKSRVQLSGAVANRHVKHGRVSAAAKSNGVSTAGAHFAQHGCNLPGDNLGDLRKSHAILVAKWQIPEQIGYGHDAAFFQRGGALRTHTTQELHRIIQSDGHAMDDCRTARGSSIATGGTRSRKAARYLPSTENASSTLPAVLP